MNEADQIYTVSSIIEFLSKSSCFAHSCTLRKTFFSVYTQRRKQAWLKYNKDENELNVWSGLSLAI